MSHGLLIYISFSLIYFALIGAAIYMGRRVVESNEEILKTLKEKL